MSSLSNSQIQDTGTDAGIGTGVGLVSGIKSREVSKQLASCAMTKLTLSRAKFEQIRVPVSQQSTVSQHQQQADRPRSGSPEQPQRRGNSGKTKGIRQYRDDGRDNGPCQSDVLRCRWSRPENAAHVLIISTANSWYAMRQRRQTRKLPFFHCLE